MLRTKDDLKMFLAENEASSAIIGWGVSRDFQTMQVDQSFSISIYDEEEDFIDEEEISKELMLELKPHLSSDDFDWNDNDVYNYSLDFSEL